MLILILISCIVKHREGEDRQVRGIREESEPTGAAIRGWIGCSREELPAGGLEGAERVLIPE